jgi:hypothetical protein
MMAKIAFELSQHVASVGVPERVRSALGGRPDLVEESPRVIVLIPPQLEFDADTGRHRPFQSAQPRPDPNMLSLC